MWRLTENEYKQLQIDIEARNRRTHDQRKRSVSVTAQAEVKAKKGRKAESKNRYKVVIIAKRQRHLDPDNIFAKWSLDEIVRAGYLPSDSSRHVDVVEKKVQRSKQEETIIEIWERTSDVLSQPDNDKR